MYYTIEIMHFDDHVFTSDFIESKSELLDILDVLLKPSMFGSDDFELRIIQVPKKHDELKNARAPENFSKTS